MAEYERFYYRVDELDKQEPTETRGFRNFKHGFGQYANDKVRAQSGKLFDAATFLGKGQADDENTLITSLGTDGHHHMAVDVDMPVRIIEDGDASIIVAQPTYRIGGKWFNMEGDSIVVRLPFKVTAVESSTPGNHHLYSDQPMTWTDYYELLNFLVQKGLVERAYADYSIARGFSALRRPGVKRSTERRSDYQPFDLEW